MSFISTPKESMETNARWTSLRGFSGCQVFLVEHEGTRFVRKISKDKDYNDRLCCQKNKQQKFKDESGSFQAIEILRDGLLPSGLYYFDMSFQAGGGSAARPLESLPLSHIQAWSHAFLSLADRKTQKETPPDLFYNKLAALKTILESLTSHPLVNESIKRLDKASWRGIPASTCHGDLTLENIIPDGNRFYLIDFLDSFAESWFVDAAKLMQDLYGHWSFRHSVMSHNTHLRLLALRDRLECGWEERYAGCLPIIKNIYILHLLRILPYCHTHEDKAFVETMLNDALQRTP